jgi:PKD repeat protein
MLTAATIIVIPLGIDLTTLANAEEQQQQQQPSNQNTGIGNGTLYQNTMDKFKVLVPAGWVIQNVNNTGPALESEAQQGYGLLAQLCPEQYKQQGGRPLTNYSSSNTLSCPGSGGDIIHIVRYPDLNAKVGFTPNDVVRDLNGTIKAIVAYQLQKLQEVGYQNIHIVNSTDRMVSVDVRSAALELIGNHNTGLPPIVKVPAKLLEMTYSTVSAPNEIRTGYILLTATGAVSTNPQIAVGYAVFYEHKPMAAVAQTGTAATTTSAAGLPLAPLPVAVRQVFNSFELMASEGIVRVMLAALSAQGGQGQVQGQAHRIVTTHTIQTQVIGGSISPLTGTLRVNATSGVAPATFEFDANVGGGRKPYTINWDFGDGSHERDKSTVVHTFDQAGKYTVIATVTDSVGQMGAAGIGITVEESSLPGGTNQNSTNPPPNSTSLDNSIPNDKISLPNSTSLVDHTPNDQTDSQQDHTPNDQTTLQDKIGLHDQTDSQQDHTPNDQTDSQDKTSSDKAES